MVCFPNKNTNLGKFLRALDWKVLIYFKAIWNILWRLGIVYDHLVHFVFILYSFIFPVLVSCTKKNLATLFGIEKKSDTQKNQVGPKWRPCLQGVALGSHQGDQIGPTFAPWTIVYFGQFFWKVQNLPAVLCYIFTECILCMNFDSNRLCHILGDFFSQTHLVALKCNDLGRRGSLLARVGLMAELYEICGFAVRPTL
jgi:hypothetical protein